MGQNYKDNDYKNGRNRKQIGYKSKDTKMNGKQYSKYQNGKYLKKNKKNNKQRMNRYRGEHRIRYGPDGGFDTMGISVPSRKKRRTKRGKKKKEDNVKRD